MKWQWFRQQWQPVPHTLRLLVLGSLILGIFFRFVNLDKKVYWHDEAYTSLRISGYTAQEFNQEVPDQLLPIQVLEKYQYPNEDKSFIDTLKSLALEDPQHPPLYYLLARWWVQSWGHSVAVIRSLSAVLSLLLFPAIYWLCWELFEIPTIGWVAIALFALSPFQVLLAQEARQYGLWAVTITFSSAALLSALRLKTRDNWAVYGLSVSLSLYTLPLSVLVVVSHGLYVLLNNWGRTIKPIIHYCLAAIAGIITFLPWIWVVTINSQRVTTTTNWAAKPLALPTLAKIWILNLSRFFLDVDFSLANPLTYLIPIILGLVGYSLYFLYCHSHKQAWLFLFLMLGVCAGIPILSDLILGARRSTVARYLLPGYLSLQIAVAYLLAAQISILHHLRQKQLVWRLTYTCLIMCGIVSCFVSANSTVWWNKYYSVNNEKVAAVINQSNQPVLISDDKLGNIFSLSYSLDSKVKLYLTSRSQNPQIKSLTGDIFLFNSSKQLRQAIANQTGKPLKKRYEDRKFNTNLWQATVKPTP